MNVFLFLAESGLRAAQVTELQHYILRMDDAATPAATASVRAASVILGNHVITLLCEQACLCRRARGCVWGVQAPCLFVYFSFKGIPFLNQMFPARPAAAVGGAYMLVSHLACSYAGVVKRTRGAFVLGQDPGQRTHWTRSYTQISP